MVASIVVACDTHELQRYNNLSREALISQLERVNKTNSAQRVFYKALSNLLPNRRIRLFCLIVSMLLDASKRMLPANVLSISSRTASRYLSSAISVVLSQ